MDGLWHQYKANPFHLIARHGSKANILQEILKRIQKEDVPEVQKISILCLLQEQSSLLLEDATLVTDAVTALIQALQQQMESPFLSHVFAQQLAVTLTTVTVEQGHDLYDGKNEIIADIVVVLTKLLGKVLKDSTRGSMDMPVLACFDELECAFPGLLQECTSMFSSWLTAERSALFQGYLMLCTACLQKLPEDAICHPMSAGSISRLLPQECLSGPQLVSIDQDLMKLLSSLLDYLPLATTSCRSHCAERMYNCLEQYRAPAKIFLSPYRSSLLSLDILVVQLSLKLLMKWSFDLGEDALQLAQQRVMILASCPSIPEEERLLIFKWASSLCVQQFPPVQLPCLYPTVFDSVDISAAKLAQLSMHLLSTTKGEPSGAVSKTMMRCLSRLQKLIYYGVNAKIAATFYYVLYMYFQHHSEAENSKEVCRLLLAVTSMQPQLISSTLDFIWALCIKEENSTVGTELLLSMLQHLAGLKITSILVHLPEYLKMIQVAADFPGIPVHLLASVLMKILQQSNICKEGDWGLGNELLSVCQCLMKRGQSLNQNKDCNAILFLISSCYNDSDISDRARFYHLGMHTLSARKLAHLLNAEGESNSENLSQLVEAELTGAPHFGQVAITYIQDCFLQLTRRNYHQNPSCEVAAFDLSDANKFLQCHPKTKCRPSVTVHYHLMFTSSEEACTRLNFPLELHALTIAFSAGVEGICIPDVFLPYLKIGDGEVCVPLTVSPDNPLPTKITVSASFCGSEGKVYSTVLAPISILFSDYFIAPNIDSQGLKGNVWSVMHAEEQELTSQLVFKDSWQWATQMTQDHLKDYVVFHGDDEIQFLLLFPSDCHLLMQWHRRETGFYVILSTDNWIVLEQATLWLYSWFSMY